MFQTAVYHPLPANFKDCMFNTSSWCVCFWAISYEKRTRVSSVKMKCKNTVQCTDSVTKGKPLKLPSNCMCNANRWFPCTKNVALSLQEVAVQWKSFYAPAVDVTYVLWEAGVFCDCTALMGWSQMTTDMEQYGTRVKRRNEMRKNNWTGMEELQERQGKWWGIVVSD